MSLGDPMPCDEVRQQFGLLLYGELPFEEEERIHEHLGVCEPCRDALASERVMHEMLEQNAELDSPSAELLAANRSQLNLALKDEPLPGGSLWARLTGRVAAMTPATVWRPIAAMAFLAVGFWSGQWYSERGHLAAARIAGEPVSARVRQVDLDGDGVLQMVVDETRQRIVRGSPDDQEIRRLLLSAAVDPTNAGLRGETVEILVSSSTGDDTRRALMHSLLEDSNDGVRLRALEGLKPYAALPEVRQAVGQALLRDSNTGLRAQAIDVLMQSNADINTEMGIVPVFQELMQRESNGYIRSQCQRKLRELKASDEVY